MCWREIEGETGEWSRHSVCVTRPLNRGYPALLPMIKSWDMLQNSMESHELGIKMKESIATLLLPYTNSFRSYTNSNTKACWHREFDCLQYYSLLLESGPTFCMSTSLPPSEDLDVSSSSLALIMNLSIVLSISCSLFTSSTVFTCLQTAAYSSSVTAANLSSVNCHTSHSLNVTFFAAILLFTELQIFSVGFKLG